MSIRFRNREQNQLTKWIGGRKKYTLLYKASRDGCTHTAFRNNCNNKGPTVTVLYNTDNFMYGGYTSASWKSIGNYQNDGSAFLFRFYQNGKWKPVRMPVVNAQNAIYDHPSYGPTFGGHDLHTFSNTVNFDGTSFPLNGSASFGVSYTMNGENYNSIANGHLRVKDIRVYLVEDLAGDTPLDGSWRKTAKWNPKLLNELKEKVEKYKPLKDLKVHQARILLVGQVGAGKSSFFNTINSIFRGYITSQACSGNAEHSLTTMVGFCQ
ncbi:unnamed protein product [Mytilus coruscus]|uniref:TLDc domain-containing protein n=1 Tax=Mytilus coruscus TaxID=42192 RepID=A0A6J7ZVT0_MYTCO|nr:unnamed protein product [Mytilus coruscus]